MAIKPGLHVVSSLSRRGQRQAAYLSLQMDRQLSPADGAAAGDRPQEGSSPGLGDGRGMLNGGGVVKPAVMDPSNTHQRVNEGLNNEKFAIILVLPDRSS